MRRKWVKQRAREGKGSFEGGERKSQRAGIRERRRSRVWNGT